MCLRGTFIDVLCWHFSYRSVRFAPPPPPLFSSHRVLAVLALLVVTVVARNLKSTNFEAHTHGMAWQMVYIQRAHSTVEDDHPHTHPWMDPSEFLRLFCACGGAPNPAYICIYIMWQTVG